MYHEHNSYLKIIRDTKCYDNACLISTEPSFTSGIFHNVSTMDSVLVNLTLHDDFLAKYIWFECIGPLIAQVHIRFGFAKTKSISKLKLILYNFELNKTKEDHIIYQTHDTFCHA